MIETITLTETSRLVVSYDEDCQSDCPRDWNDAASVHPLRLNDHYHPPAPGIDSHADAIEAILEWVPFGRWERGYREARDAAIEKHFTRAGIPFVIEEHNSQRDFVGVFVWYVEPQSDNSDDWTEQTLRSEIDTYKKWADGEVYNVELQRRQSYVKRRVDRTPTGFEELPDEPELFDEWETVESIGGCYLDDLDYPAEVVAREHWDLTDEELAGMKVKLDSYDRRVAEREAVPA